MVLKLSEVSTSQLRVFYFRTSTRSKNSYADSLETLTTSTGKSLLRIILVENLVTFAYDKQTLARANFIQAGPSWMDPIVSFLKDGTLPDDKTKAKKACRKAPRY